MRVAEYDSIPRLSTVPLARKGVVHKFVDLDMRPEQGNPFHNPASEAASAPAGWVRASVFLRGRSTHCLAHEFLNIDVAHAGT